MKKTLLSGLFLGVLTSCGTENKEDSEIQKIRRGSNAMVETCIAYQGGVQACEKKYGKTSSSQDSYSPAVNTCIQYGGGVDSCKKKYGKVSTTVSTTISSVGSSIPSFTNTGAKLASIVQSRAIGFTGRCYQYVADALVAADILPDAKWYSLNIPPTSAYQFGDWAARNPTDLKTHMGYASWSGDASKAPLGSVIVWSRGQCGYSRSHGHIEIAVGNGRACSDGCGPIATGCGQPRIFAPLN